tara:strand:+ start:504 stop:1898 length:1395 start_codon:yes stop_codon:yes gene_type:complete
MDEIEAQKRINYFDLGRDDFMALEEYLLSGLSDRDLGKAEGGIVSLYANGGPVGSQLFGVDRPSQRTTGAKYSDVIRKIGEVLKKNWVTDKGGVDFKKFNRFALKHGVDALDKSKAGQKNMVRFLNSFSKQTGMKYEPVMWDPPGTGQKYYTGETKIRQQPGSIGAKLNREIYDKGQKLNNTALKKFPKSRTDRLKYIVDGLYKKFNKYEGVTKKFLKEFVKRGKFLTPWGAMTGLAMEMMESPGYMNAIGLGEPQVMTFNEGGMMDINDMTRPLGYAIGGDVLDNIRDQIRRERTIKGIPLSIFDRLSQEEQREMLGPSGNKTEMDMFLEHLSQEEQREMLALAEQRKMLALEEQRKMLGNLNQAEMDMLQESEVGTFAEERSFLDKINDFLKYGWGDKEDYMEIGGEQVDPDDPNFRRFIEENYMGEGESYIEGIENYRMEVEGRGFQSGGIVSLNHMTRAL